MVGVNYTPKLVSSQLVAGMNYRFICEAEAGEYKIEPYEATIQVFAPLNNGTPIVVTIITNSLDNGIGKSLKPLPTYNDVRPHVVLNMQYYLLYGYYFFEIPLPSDFPKSIISQFPNKSYKRQLKAAINMQTSKINDLEGIQNDYLSDYYVLYLHYANGVKLPVDFPQQILSQFPSKSYKEQLKKSISNLQTEINNEKAKL